MPLTQLIYASNAAREFCDDELAAILDSSIRHNRQNGITGLLLYARGTFLQALEGKQVAVEETYERIKKDNRHTELAVVEWAPILRRSFSDWSMGFRRCDTPEAAAMLGRSRILETGFQAAELIQDPNFAKAALEKFARTSTAAIA